MVLVTWVLLVLLLVQVLLVLLMVLLRLMLTDPPRRYVRLAYFFSRGDVDGGRNSVKCRVGVGVIDGVVLSLLLLMMLMMLLELVLRERLREREGEGGTFQVTCAQGARAGKLNLRQWTGAKTSGMVFERLHERHGKSTKPKLPSPDHFDGA